METCENGIGVVTQEISEGEEDQNHFNRLPDELIVSHIFGKIPEAKTLFSCYLLSKRFACLVLQSQTISCTIFGIPGWSPSQMNSAATASMQSLSMPQKILHSLKRVNPVRFLSGLSKKFRPSSSSSDKSRSLLVQLLSFVRQFRSLRLLCVEIDFSGPDKRMKTPSSLTIEGGPNSPKFPRGPVFKWRAEQKPQNSGSFVLFHARSVAALGPAGSDDEEEGNDEEVVELNRQQLDKEMLILGEVSKGARLRLTMFETFAPVLPDQIRSIVITDSMKQGKAVLGEAKLAELRSGTNVNPDENDKLQLKVWYERVVRLPSSGCVMKEASIFALKMGALVDDEDAESIVKDAFEGEEEAFGAAVWKMLKKPALIEENGTASMF